MTTMEAERTGQSLLDYLARRAGCTCLSDLREAAYRRRVSMIISEIPAWQFPLNSWMDVAAYLGKRDAAGACDTPEEVKQALCRAYERE